MDRAIRSPLDVTVIVLTFNEAIHLARCLESVRGFAARIVVVDSHSSDDTVVIARRAGADVLSNAWTDHATQLNWALDHADIRTGWVFRLDADEVVTPRLCEVMRARLPAAPDGVAGLTVRRQIHFLGRWIRHGGIYPIAVLRVWRHGRGRCERRSMDEHVLVDGDVAALDGDIADINLNDVGWWTRKHEQYATREAIEVLRGDSERDGRAPAMRMSGQARTKRWIKENLYGRLPLGGRAALYFLWRYVFRLGFLDGWQGFLFHVLQGLWYRILVDAKVWELSRLMAERNATLDDVLRDTRPSGR